MIFLCFNDTKMRHLKNRSLEKCLVSYRFINFKLFHPEQRNFDRTDMRFLDTCISRMIFDTEISRFTMTYFFNLAHVCSKLLHCLIFLPRWQILFNRKIYKCKKFYSSRFRERLPSSSFGNDPRLMNDHKRFIFSQFLPFYPKRWSLLHLSSFSRCDGRLRLLDDPGPEAGIIKIWARISKQRQLNNTEEYETLIFKRLDEFWNFHLSIT